MTKLTHLDENGAARMVDVSDKPPTPREASAESIVTLSAQAFAAVMEGSAPKGDVLAAARIAGIMAAKKVPELIPLCHPVAITGAAVQFEALGERNAIRIVATVKTAGQTGVEMEALTAASVAALTVYDMIKAVDRAAVIESVRLLAKSGGKSGDYQAPPDSKSAPAPRRGDQARKSAGMIQAPTSRRGERPKPQTIMGEVFGPRAEPSQSREKFRSFMTGRHLRATQWAKDAGVPVGEIMAFLTGRSRGFSPEVADKLARAAKVCADDMFQ